MRLTAGAIAPTLQALIAMVGNGPETLVQPHLWPEERLVWCERPTSLGAVLAQVSHAYKKANAAVEVFSAPLSLFVGLGWLVGITPVLIFVLWFPLGLGLAAVIVALVAAVATGLYGWHRARGTCYAITDRRVLAVRGADSDWTLHEAWDRARVAWQLGGIGTVAFSRSGEGDLDVRFVGVQSPKEIVEVVSGAALERRRRACRGVSRHETKPAPLRQRRVVAAPAVLLGYGRGGERAALVPR